MNLIKTALAFAALIACIMPTAHTQATNTPYEGLYYLQSYSMHFTDYDVQSYINFRLMPDETEANTYILAGLVHDVIEHNRFTDDGSIEQLADLKAVLDPESGRLTIKPGQIVMRQKYSADGEWHNIYFTGGYCGWDFWKEEDLKETYEKDGHNLAVKDLAVVLTPHYTKGVPLYTNDANFFFVWDNPESDTERIHYANFFEISGAVTAFNAVNCPGKMDSQGLPVPPVKSFYNSTEENLEGWTTFVEVIDNSITITGGFGEPIGSANTPIVFSKTGDDGEWYAENTLTSIFGNPCYKFVEEANEDGTKASGSGLTITWGKKDEWGNPLVGLPGWGTTLYYDLDKTKVFLPFKAIKNVPSNIVLYRELPDLKFVGESAIPMVGNDISLKTPEYYNLQGMRISNPERGTIVIERCGTVTRKKVFL